MVGKVDRGRTFLGIDRNLIFRLRPYRTVSSPRLRPYTVPYRRIRSKNRIVYGRIVYGRILYGRIRYGRIRYGTRLRSVPSSTLALAPAADDCPGQFAFSSGQKPGTREGCEAGTCPTSLAPLLNLI